MKQNKRAVSMTTKVAVGLIILIVALIVVISIFVRLNDLSATVSNPDVQICLQSALTTGLLTQNPLTGQTFVPFNCPTSVKQISIRNLDSASSYDATKMKEYGYQPNQVALYKTDSAMWQQVSECYQKVNYGKSNLFDRKVMIDKRYCVVCSVVTFDPTIQSKVDYSENTITQLLEKKSDAMTGKSITMTLGERSNVVGLPASTYMTQGKQAVVYFRTSAAVLSHWFITWPSRFFANSFTLTFPDDDKQQDTSVTQKSFGDIISKAYDATRIADYDADGVMILPYESKDSLSEIGCDILGNEKYIPG